MKVGQIMSQPVVTTSPTTLVNDVWKLIFKTHIHGLPIVDNHQKLIGIVSEEDLLRKLYPNYAEIIPDFSAGEDFEGEMGEKLEKLKKMTVEKVMNKQVVSTSPDSNVMRALSRMIIRKVRQLPVLSAHGKIIGMISKGDIFDGLFKKRVKRLLLKK